MNWTPERKAALRNKRIAERNAKKADKNPLFAHAGLLDQVVALEDPIWDAQRVKDMDLARAVQADFDDCRQMKLHTQQYIAYRSMLIAVIGLDATIQIETAWFAERWRGHNAVAAICHLSRHLQSITGRTPLDLYDEAVRMARSITVSQKDIADLHRRAYKFHEYCEGSHDAP